MSTKSPFVLKTASQIKSELLEHIINGYVPIVDEKHNNDSTNKLFSGDSPPLSYKIQCGAPDLANGVLVSIDRIWGVRNSSFYEFQLTTDYTFDTSTNTLTFVNGNEPDLGTQFAVSYKYDQGYSSGITNTAPGTVIDSLISGVAFKLAEMYNAILLAKVSAFIDQAVGDDLAQLLLLINVKKKSASASSGYVTVFRSTISGTVSIPIGIQFSTDASDTLNAIFFTSNAIAYFIDGFSSARVPINALTGYEGSQGNVAPNTIKNIINPQAGIVRVINPPTYSDYEFIDLLAGKYLYGLSQIPQRVINSGITFPLAVTDKGLYSVNYWTDKSINETNWNNNDSGQIAVTENDPETGTTKIVVTGTPTSGTYLERNGLSIPRDNTTQFSQGYDDVIIRIRSPTANAQFSIKVIDSSAVESTVSFYQFGSSNVANNSPTLTNNWTIFYAGHGLAGTVTDPISKVQIILKTVGTYYVDIIAVGTILQEIQGTLSAVDQITTSYTSGNMSLYQSSPSDFFSAYDGDPSDGHGDQLFVYYEWRNNISGGADEETDTQLRARGKTKIAGIGSGTENAIKSALLEIEGITQVSVKDINDDPSIIKGVTYVTLLAQGFRISPALNNTITSVINSIRSAGIEVIVQLPQVRYVNFTLNVIYDDTNALYTGTDGKNALITIIKSVISDYFTDKAGADKNLYWSDLVAYIIANLNVVQGGYVDNDGSTTPSYVDDNYAGTYAYNSPLTVIYTNYISASKTGVSIVIQGGNSVNVTLIGASTL